MAWIDEFTEKKNKAVFDHTTAKKAELNKAAGGPENIGDTAVSYIYPHEMGKQTFYPEAIKFTVYKRESASMEAVEQAMKAAWAELGSKTITRLNTQGQNSIYKGEKPMSAEEERDIREAAEAVKNGDTSDRWLDTMTRYLQNTYAGDTYKGIKQVLRTASSGLRQSHIDHAKQLANIYLNMPNEITFAEPVAWEGTDLGTLGAMGKTSGSAWEAGVVGNLGNLVGGGSGALAGILGKHFSKIPGLGMMSGAVLGSLGGNTVQKMFESSFGNIANPYKEMTFSGIGFREFSFNFVFRARNESEANAVKNIIECFRFYSKPSYHQGSSLLNYPDEFHIQFLTKPEMGNASIAEEVKTTRDRFITNTNIPQIKMCVCKGVTTNYTSQNTWRALKTGAPVEISLGLQFEETELVTREDVNGTATIGRFKGKGKF